MQSHGGCKLLYDFFVQIILFIDVFIELLQDIADLFGADLPVEGGSGGQFTWRDGLFLQALKMGHWVVLDEVCMMLTLYTVDIFIVSYALATVAR